MPRQIRSTANVAIVRCEYTKLRYIQRQQQQQNQLFISRMKFKIQSTFIVCKTVACIPSIFLLLLPTWNDRMCFCFFFFFNASRSIFIHLQSLNSPPHHAFVPYYNRNIHFWCTLSRENPLCITCYIMETVHTQPTDRRHRTNLI